MTDEPRYTEAQWRTKLVHDECAADGHRVANYVINGYGADSALVGYCECCEVRWVKEKSLRDTMVSSAAAEHARPSPEADE